MCECAEVFCKYLVKINFRKLSFLCQLVFLELPLKFAARRGDQTVNVSGLAGNMGESVIYVRTHGILGRLCNRWDTSWDTWENLILMGEIWDT